MHATTIRYFAFVSKFVDAVTTSALDDEFSRAVTLKRLERQSRRRAAATTEEIPLDRAA